VNSLPDGAVLLLQVAHDFERRDAVIARDLLEDAVGIERKSRRKRKPLALLNCLCRHAATPRP
jgi:hypothetical protein